MITGERVYLRAPDIADLELIHRWENDLEVRVVSDFRQPVSEFAVEQYILSCSTDPWQSGQLRLMAAKRSDNVVIGHLDLFDLDAMHRRAGIGILIEPSERGKGYAAEMLRLTIGWCRNHLELYQLWCQITLPNDSSMKLFTGEGFLHTGTKKEWLRRNREWHDVAFMQKTLT
jgi:diamine N-acetyltransferase